MARSVRSAGHPGHSIARSSACLEGGEGVWRRGGEARGGGARDSVALAIEYKIARLEMEGSAAQAWGADSQSGSCRHSRPMVVWTAVCGTALTMVPSALRFGRAVFELVPRAPTVSQLPIYPTSVALIRAPRPSPPTPPRRPLRLRGKEKKGSARSARRDRIPDSTPFMMISVGFFSLSTTLVAQLGRPAALEQTRGFGSFAVIHLPSHWLGTEGRRCSLSGQWDVQWAGMGMHRVC